MDDNNKELLNNESVIGEEQNKNETTKFNLKIDDVIAEIPEYGESSAKPKKKNKVLSKIIIVVLLIAISVALATTIILVSKDIFGFGKDSKTFVIQVEEGWGVSQIADELEEEGVIASAFLFKAYFKVANLTADFKVGTYTVNSNMSYSVLVSKLSEYGENSDMVTVTLIEGNTVYQMAETLEKNGICTATEFINTLEKVDFGFDFEADISNNDNRAYKYEGFLFPDTYNFIKDQNPEDVAATILKNTDKKLNAELRKQIKDAGYTLDEFITLASVVQREGIDAESMSTIASVYINRLNNSSEYPRLQADPTALYAKELLKNNNKITQEQADMYDTYECNGLPIGPICNPSMMAIEATLAPDETDYYFFCSDSSMTKFYFAKTYAEHQKNLVKAGLR